MINSNPVIVVPLYNTQIHPWAEAGMNQKGTV